jgi:hypothetical protein
MSPTHVRETSTRRASASGLRDPGTAHSFLVTEAGLGGDDINGVSALLYHQPVALEAENHLMDRRVD